MKLIDIIIILIITAILVAAIAYIVRAKKKGAKCIGCPAGDCCSMKKGCGEQSKTKAEDSGCCCCGKN